MTYLLDVQLTEMDRTEDRLTFPTGPNVPLWEADRMVFMAGVLAGRQPFTGGIDVDDMPEGIVPLPDGFTVVSRYRGVVRDRVRATSDGASVLVSRDGSSMTINWSASSPKMCELIAEAIKDRLPDQETSLEALIWRRSPEGSAVRRAQVLEAPSWDGVIGNYPRRTVARLDPIMRLDGAPESGRLLLWHGAPGTGKTRAVLALLEQWRSWCDGHVVADPERLFEDPSYLLEVVYSIGAPGTRRRPSAASDRWALIVAEDADEYLRSDADRRSGPALGRLLNLTDGVLGQSRRVLVLLTTNDDIGRLHPAVTRPGRCAAVVDFEPFTPAEAAVWLAGRAPTPTSLRTLADLYELVAQRKAPGVRSDIARPGAYL